MIPGVRPSFGRSRLRIALCIVLVCASLVLTSGEGLASKRSQKSSGKKSGQALRGRGKASARSSRKSGGRERRVSSRGRGRKRSRASHRARSYAGADAPSTPRVSGIPPERATEIQNALIKRGYLDGPASGQWDDNSVDAMKQFQYDNGFPTTGQPSALALKRLGVSKRPQDGYAVPVSSVADKDGSKSSDQEKPKKPQS